MEVGQRLQEALAAHYRFERELGRGGMAVVHLAHDLKHDRPVAIKVLRPELSALVGAERFSREIRIVSRLTHPHILPLHDSGEAAGLLYFVMPFVQGETLRARLEARGPLPLDEIVRITGEVCSAIGFAHAQGIVHRDLKPGNILLEAGHAVVADFGIARVMDTEHADTVSSAGFVIGTPAYMSPEQAGGEPVDARSDVYSLGCVLYEMLTGEPPFTARTAQGMAARHRSEQVPSISVVRPNVPAEVVEVVERALAKNPADRWASADALATALRAAAGEPVSAPTTRSPARRRPWSTPIGVLGVALLLATGLALAWAMRPAAGASGSLDAPASRIAILYFDHDQGDTTLASMAAGLTEDLIDQLARVPLDVITPNGVKPFRGRAVPPDSIASVLGVGSLVEGTLRRVAPDSLRLTVRLRSARGVQMDAGAFTRSSGDLLGLRDEAVEEVARFLRERLGREIALTAQRTGARSTEGWALVQSARRIWEEALRIGQSDPEGFTRRLEESRALVRQAAALEPAWHYPRTMMAWMHFEEAVWRAQGEPATDSASGGSLLAAIEEAEAAHRLAPEEGEPRVVAAAARLSLAQASPLAADTLLRRAEADLRATLASSSKPSAQAWYYLSLVYLMQGRQAASEDAAAQAYAADAWLDEARGILNRLLFAALFAGRYEDAMGHCREGMRRFPTFAAFQECELTILGWSGRGDSAIRAAWGELRGIDSLPGPTTGTWAVRRLLVAAVLARSGRADSAARVVEQAWAEPARRNARPAFLNYEAYVALLSGRREEALTLLGRWLEAYPQYRTMAAESPWFRELRGDSTFARLTATD